MKKIPFFFFLLITTMTQQTGFAEPVGKLVINENTKQCTIILGGDECMDCSPVSEEWKVINIGATQPCPKGYQGVEHTQIKTKCQSYKTQFCCTRGHSGVHGDCEDMIINDKTKKCAFVDNIKNCVLPTGWKRKAPEETSSTEWECPYDTWDNKVECLKVD